MIYISRREYYNHARKQRNFSLSTHQNMSISLTGKAQENSDYTLSCTMPSYNSCAETDLGGELGHFYLPINWPPFILLALTQGSLLGGGALKMFCSP